MEKIHTQGEKGEKLMSNNTIVHPYVVRSDGSVLGKKGQPLKLGKNPAGYFNLSTWSAGKVQKTYSVHRLVALAFIPNPKNLPEVNHKDGNKANNHWKNLEWCTKKYNVIHGFKTGLTTPGWKGKTGALNPRSKPIQRLDAAGNITEFVSLKEAAKKTKINRNTITKYLTGKREAEEGYTWRYSPNKGAKKLIEAIPVNMRLPPCRDCAYIVIINNEGSERYEQADYMAAKKVFVTHGFGYKNDKITHWIDNPKKIKK